MRKHYIKSIILALAVFASWSESTCGTAERSFFNRIHDTVNTICDLDDYVHMAYPRSYTLGVAVSLAGIAYGVYYYILISYAKDILQECDYDLDKFAHNCPKEYQNNEKILKKLLINSKDTVVINKRNQLLLNRIHDRLYAESYWEKLSNKDLVNATLTQSKNEFLQLYHSNETWFDKQIATIKQEIIIRHQELFLKTVEDHLSAIPWNEWNKQEVNIGLVRSLNDNRFLSLYNYHENWADGQITRIRQEIASQLNKLRESYRKKYGKDAPEEWSLKKLKRKEIGLGEILLATAALFGIMSMK